MKPPLRAEDHDEVAAKAILARGNDQSSCSGMDVGAFFRKDIDAFMSNRFAPGIGPERLLVVAMAGGPFYGHREVLGDDPADGQDGCKDKSGFEAGSTAGIVAFHNEEDNTGCPAMQQAVAKLVLMLALHIFVPGLANFQ